jgi:hypothetical protein
MKAPDAPMTHSSSKRYRLRLCVTTVLVRLGSAVLFGACQPAEPPSVLPALPLRLIEPAGSPPPPALPPSAVESPLPSQRPRPACVFQPPRIVDAGAADAAVKDGGLPPVRNAEAVIALLRRSFRACYNKGLAVDPLQEGCVTLVVRIAPDGSVTSTDPRYVDGLSPAVTLCLESVLRDAHFDPPGAAGAVLQVPAKFVRQSPASPPPPSDAGQD